MKLILGVLTLSLLIACSNQQPKSKLDSPDTEVIQCPDERPQVCTMDYRPVCATRDTGVRCITTPCPSSELKTYSNACTACTDTNVISYTVNECKPPADQ